MPDLNDTEAAALITDETTATLGAITFNVKFWLDKMRGGENARTETLTETTIENTENSWPTALQLLKVASEYKMETEEQFTKETSEELLLACTHSGARIVFRKASYTRTENDDKSIWPCENGCPKIRLENWIEVGAPATTLNEPDMQETE
jgi:hypothetical protein